MFRPDSRLRPSAAAPDKRRANGAPKTPARAASRTAEAVPTATGGAGGMPHAAAKGATRGGPAPRRSALATSRRAPPEAAMLLLLLLLLPTLLPTLLLELRDTLRIVEEGGVAERKARQLRGASSTAPGLVNAPHYLDVVFLVWVWAASNGRRQVFPESPL
eukprot:359335-Chlamydomonas_euryale.AAC.3